MATGYYTSDTTAHSNYVWPYPNLPYIQPYTYPYASFVWPSSDQERIAALEARLAKLERENKRLKRGLGNLYKRQKEQRDGNR